MATIETSTPRRTRKVLRKQIYEAWELFYAEEFIKLERVMLAMAEQYPEQHRVLAKNMAAAIHDQYDMDCLEEIGL